MIETENGLSVGTAQLLYVSLKWVKKLSRWRYMSILVPALLKLVFKFVNKCVFVDQSIEDGYTRMMLISVTSTGSRDGSWFMLRAKAMLFAQSLCYRCTPRSLVSVERTLVAVDSHGIMDCNTCHLSYRLYNNCNWGIRSKKREIWDTYMFIIWLWALWRWCYTKQLSSCYNIYGIFQTAS